MAIDLFGSKAKKDAAKNEAMQKLSKVDLVDDLIQNYVAREESWLKECQNYYDDCSRLITIESDSFVAEWFEYEEEKVCTGTYDNGSPRFETKISKKIFGNVVYSFTKSGYEPLPEYVASSGQKLSSGEICEIFAGIVRERMAVAMPTCKFDETNGNKFYYHVPRPAWKKWF